MQEVINKSDKMRREGIKINVGGIWIKPETMFKRRVKSINK
jgi:hypothetical protein